MAFLFSGPESGHTERRAAQSTAVATVLFHPDFNRRLRNHTESADPSPLEKKALAGLGLSTLTAGGDFHPALRTSAARYERPASIMAIWGGASKRQCRENLHVPHDGSGTLPGVMAGLDPAIHLSSEDSSEAGWMRGSSPRMTPRWDSEINHCGKSSGPIPFCSNR
jgi:hypothetical protein